MSSTDVLLLATRELDDKNLAVWCVEDGLLDELFRHIDQRLGDLCD